MSKGSKIRVRGLVQGVGFRPTVWRLAHQNQITGNVLNDGEGVLIETWDSNAQLEKFIADLKAECPPLARIDSIEQCIEYSRRVNSGIQILQVSAKSGEGLEDW